MWPSRTGPPTYLDIPMRKDNSHDSWSFADNDLKKTKHLNQCALFSDKQTELIFDKIRARYSHSYFLVNESHTAQQQCGPFNDCTIDLNLFFFLRIALFCKTIRCWRCMSYDMLYPIHGCNSWDTDMQIYSTWRTMFHYWILECLEDNADNLCNLFADVRDMTRPIQFIINDHC